MKNKLLTLLAALVMPLTAFAGPYDNQVTTNAYQLGSVMTTTGDMIYQNNVGGPTRLPIGSSGQLMCVSSGVPAWCSTAQVPGDLIFSTAATGTVYGETSRAANVTTVTTLAAPIYDSVVGANTDAAAIVATGASASGANVDIFKTRATSGQASTIVNNGDVIGKINFYGADGSAYQPAASIQSKIDAAPGAANMPGSLSLYTTPSGSNTLTLALKLGNDQNATFGNNITLPGSLTMSATTSQIIPGVTSIAFRNNANSANNLLVTDAGNVTIKGSTTTTNVLIPTANYESVAGAGTNQGNAAALSGTALLHRLTGANGTVGWILPATSTAGTMHTFLNTTAGVANIYPASGGTINGGAANAVFAALTGIKPIICYATGTDTWICA